MTTIRSRTTSAKQVTVAGDAARRRGEVDVETVDGVALREPGKPPWAGGWKAVGSSAIRAGRQEKADRWQAKRAKTRPSRHGVDVLAARPVQGQGQQPAPGD